MARDDDAAGVDFVTGRNDDSGDEELPAPQRPQRRNPRWTLAGGAVVLVGAALIARAVSHQSQPGTSPSSSSAPSSSSVAAAAPPSSADPRRADFAAPMCQRPASCSLSSTLPSATVDALFAAFPDVRVVSSSTVLSTRADKMAPDVVRRDITAQAGPTSITIRIVMRVPIDSREVEQHQGATTSTTTVNSIELGYLISVRATRAGKPVPVTTVAHLGTDGRLVLPQ